MTADEQEEMTGSQLAGALVGGVIGNVKGTGAGIALFAATAPFLGPLAILTLFALPTAGAIAGTVVGARVGSKGLGRAALMAVGTGAADLLPDGGGAFPGSGGRSA